MQNVQFIDNDVIKNNLYPGNGFKLSSDPVSFQLTIHINNLFSFFIKADNEWISYSIQDVIDVLNKESFELDDPFEARIEQIVSFYGLQSIIHYIKLIYDKDMMVGGAE